MISDRHTLLQQRLASAGLRSGSTGSREHVIARRSNPKQARLSFAQQHAWRYQLAYPDSVSNNLGLLIKFNGQVDEHAIAEAFERIVQRHEVLRTTYHIGEDGIPFQQIHHSLRFSSVFAYASFDEAFRIAQTSLFTVFDLGSESPLRLLLFRTHEEQVIVVIIVHHIVWDGATFDIISKEIEQAYINPSIAVPDLPIQYGDFAEWQRDHHKQIVDKEQSFWSNHLANLCPSHRSIMGKDSLPFPDESAGRVDYQLNSFVELNNLATKNKVTLFIAFMACWAAVLGQNNADEVTIGTTVLTRDQLGTEKLIGNFANHIVLRINLSSSKTLITTVAQEFDQAFTHRNLSYEEVAEAICGQKIDTPPDLFDSLVVFIPSGTTGPCLPNVNTEWQRLHNNSTQFPLVPLGIEVFVRGNGAQKTINIEATYARNKFDADTISKLLIRLDKMICNAVQEGW